MNNEIPSVIKKKFISRLKHQGINNVKVLEAMSSIPRHLFVEPAFSGRAYDDDALPIGFKQTISSPYIVGKMSQLLIEEDKMNKVLEIGTGCGYQTFILSQLFNTVTTIERIEQLQLKTQKLFIKYDLKNIKSIYGDGHVGYKNNAPYDAIIMTASPSEIPKKLVDQLTAVSYTHLTLPTKRIV